MNSVLLFFLNPTIIFASNFFQIDTKDYFLKDIEKVELCQDLADEQFCESRIDKERCLKDFSFSSEIKTIKNQPKLILSKKTKLQSNESGIKYTFTKLDTHTVKIQGNKGITTSNYSHSSYSIKGEDSKYVPSFILNSTCRGDGDSD